MTVHLISKGCPLVQQCIASLATRASFQCNAVLISRTDFKPGGIDAILAQLKPKPSSRTIDPSTLKIPCSNCKAFDLADMPAYYSEMHTMCPSCRQKTNTGLPTSPPLAENCVKCGFDLLQMDQGYAPLNTMCPTCREKSHTSAAAPIQHYASAQQAVSSSVHGRFDGLTHSLIAVVGKRAGFDRLDSRSSDRFGAQPFQRAKPAFRTATFGEP